MQQITMWTKTFLFFYFPLLLWLGVIFYFSSQSGYAASRELRIGELLLRKSAHVSEFFLLAALVFRVVWRHFYGVPRIAFFVAGSLSLLCASLDELHQYFVPLREARVTDIGIDCIGIGFALVVFFILMKISKKKEYGNGASV